MLGLNFTTAKSLIIKLIISVTVFISTFINLSILSRYIQLLYHCRKWIMVKLQGNILLLLGIEILSSD